MKKKFYKSTPRMTDTVEEKQLKRLCRAVVLRHMIDVVHFELRGDLPAYTKVNEMEMIREALGAKKFLFSRDGAMYCRGAGLPVDTMRALLNISDTKKQECLLDQLDRAYKAVTREGMR